MKCIYIRNYDTRLPKVEEKANMPSTDLIIEQAKGSALEWANNLVTRHPFMFLVVSMWHWPNKMHIIYTGMYNAISGHVDWIHHHPELQRYLDTDDIRKPDEIYYYVTDRANSRTSRDGYEYKKWIEMTKEAVDLMCEVESGITVSYTTTIDAVLDSSVNRKAE